MSPIVTSELMFELYSVPSLTYTVDSVMSFYHNNLPPNSSPFTSDGLVVSFNTASTSIIPILSGKGVMSQAKRSVFVSIWSYSAVIYIYILTFSINIRIPWGSSQATEYLLKLIQLKYPTFSTRVLPAQTSVRALSFVLFRISC